jgi:hypothetical protein
MPLSRHAIGLEKRASYRDLLADLERVGCPACHGAHRAAWRCIDALLWESVNDPETRARLRATHGFCRTHASMALAIASQQGDSLGMAILYEDFLRNLHDEVLDALGSKARRGKRPSLQPNRPCIICASADSTAANYLAILAAAEEGTEPWLAIRRPERGLCLPHLALGLRSHRSGQERARLADAFFHGETELRASLKELIRKHDYRFHDEGITDEERASWVHAVRRIVGEPAPRRRPER